MTRIRSVSLGLAALVLVAWTTAPSLMAKTQLMANATVKAVTASALTVTAGSKDMTFSVDAKTKVIGKGIGTKADKKGGKAAITDLVTVGDIVSVTYDDSGSTPRATRVQVAAKPK
jgi:hypothetical protein